MDRFVYTALNGNLDSTLPRLQLTNELANLSTTGFKRSFSVATKSLKIEGPGLDTRFLPSTTGSDLISLAAGPKMVTGNPLDVAMNGNTVLGVTASNGDLAFTRRGDMRVNSAGQLEIGTGQAVRGQSGPLTVPPGYAIEIAGDGSVYAHAPDSTKPGASVLVGKLMLREASGTGLERRDDGLFKVAGDQTSGGGDIKPSNIAPSITNGTLEGSNVTPFDAMVRLMDFTRTFESRMKFIKEGSTLDEAGASMMKGG
jgi:flagellar basal-body rod protein FlgF